MFQSLFQRLEICGNILQSAQAFALVEPKPPILIVEDEDQVRGFIKTTLSHGGYEVLEASGGLEAMATLLSYPGDIPLAIVDIVMPGVSGLDFANQVQMDRPQTKVLYISGFTDSIAVDSITRRQPVAMLNKPFTARALLERVRELLAA